MYHYVARTRSRRRLFPSDAHARALWSSLTGAFPELFALCLMPDHIHLLHPDPGGLVRLGPVMSGHARRMGGGVLWEPAPVEEKVPDGQRVRRTLRYVLLNPCRAGLVEDPLSWPWSTHRDRVGLVAAPVGPVEPDAARFHRFVSADSTCAAEGTPFPVVASAARSVEEVFDAVAALCRCPPSELERRGFPRTLALRSVLRLIPSEFDAVAAALGLGAMQTHRLRQGSPEAAAQADRAVLSVRRVVGDPRFRPLREATRTDRAIPSKPPRK
jgi:putative transposase